MSTAPDLGIDDLVDAFVLNHRWKDCELFEDEPTYIVEYHKLRLKLMKQLFDCDLEKAEEELQAKQKARQRKQQQVDEEEGETSLEARYEFNGRLTVRLLEDCVELINKSQSPFPRCLAGMPPKILRELDEKHSEPLWEHEKAVKQIYRQIIKDILIYLFPGIEAKNFNASILQEMGLPEEEPDPDDYF